MHRRTAKRDRQLSLDPGSQDAGSADGQTQRPISRSGALTPGLESDDSDSEPPCTLPQAIYEKATKMVECISSVDVSYDGGVVENGVEKRRLYHLVVNTMRCENLKYMHLHAKRGC